VFLPPTSSDTFENVDSNENHDSILTHQITNDGELGKKTHIGKGPLDHKGRWP
jgi:hypothetical protein